jgi:hypothetical protein
MSETTKAGAVGAATGQGSGARGNSPAAHCTTIYLRGKPVMYIRNGVAVRRAKADDMLRRPPGWSFHLEVLQQLEAAQVTHLRVECEGHTYTATWAAFVSFSAPLDRGFGAQRFLPLAYWSVDGAVPERAPRISAAWGQLALWPEVAP